MVPAVSGDLISIFRCKHCDVRMFERDREGHLRRHGMDAIAGELAAHFVKGPPDTLPRPGARGEGIYQVHQQRKKAKPDRAVSDDEDLAP